MPSPNTLIKAPWRAIYCRVSGVIPALPCDSRNAPCLIGHPGSCFDNYHSFLPNFHWTTGLSLRPVAEEAMAPMMTESPASTTASSASYDPANSPQGYRGERGYRAAPPVTRSSSRVIAAGAYDGSQMNLYTTDPNSVPHPYSNVQPLLPLIATSIR